MKLCFVCLGNICRSPTAEGVMRALVDEAGLAGRIEVDSAGTAAYHVGEPPDRRAQATAAARGVDLSGLRARRFHAGDFAYFDLVLVMDRSNYVDVVDLAPDHAAAARVHLLREFEPERGEDGLEVGDPYYGGPDGFDRVFDQITEACRGLLAHVQQRSAP